MNLLSFCTLRYFALPFENFTGKLIAALGLFKIIDKPNEKDLLKVKFIEENTHKKVMVSLYKLDRIVNPTKGEFKTVANKATFFKNNATEEDSEITLSEDEIQYYLCKAIRRVHEIVIKNLRDYGEEFKMPKIEISNEKDDLDIKKQLEENT